MSSYQLDNDFLLHEKNNGKLCPCSPLSYLSNVCSCILLPFKLCIGLTWIGSCGFFFYLGNLYSKEQIFNITHEK